MIFFFSYRLVIGDSFLIEHNSICQRAVLPSQESFVHICKIGARTRLEMVAAKVYKRNEQGRKKSAAILAGMPPSPVDAAGVSLKSFFYTQCIQCGPPVRARRYRRSIAISRCESEEKEGGKNY